MPGFFFLRVLAAAALLALLAGCREPEARMRPDDAPLRAGALAPFLAGIASVEFTPEPGYPLVGYGGGDCREEWPFYYGLG